MSYCTKKHRRALLADKICFYCGCFSDDLTIDHIIPTSKGGTSHPTNLVPACRRCNSFKQAFSLTEFKERLLAKREKTFIYAMRYLSKIRKAKRRKNVYDNDYIGFIKELLYYKGEHSYFTTIIHSLDTLLSRDEKTIQC